MSTKRVGKATQDMSKGFLPKKGYDSVKTGKVGGKTHTSSVASPNKLKVGTAEGRGGTQKSSPGDVACAGQREGGGYTVPLKKG